MFCWYATIKFQGHDLAIAQTLLHRPLRHPVQRDWCLHLQVKVWPQRIGQREATLEWSQSSLRPLHEFS
jgi:hypothetical protein